MRLWTTGLVLFFAASASLATTCNEFKSAIAKGTEPQKLKHFLDLQWQETMSDYPDYATYLGYPGQNDRLTDMSRPAIEARQQAQQCQLDVLKKINRKKLQGEDRVNLDMALNDLNLSLEGYKFNGDVLAINQMNGLQIDFPDLLENMPQTTIQDYENILVRLDKVSTYASQIQDLLKEGVKKGITTPKMFMQKVPAQFDSITPEKIESSPLYKQFAEMKPSISPEDQHRLQAKAKEIIESTTYPALKKLRDYIATEYIPNATESTSLSNMPKGADWYAYLVKMHTTTSMTPDELHQLGLKEVDRLIKDMEAIKQSVSFKGDLKAFNEKLLSDSDFYYTDKKDLLTGYRDIAKRIDAQLPRLFKLLPRNTYGVREMAAYKAASAPTAYYQPGSLQAGRPGYFEANLYNLKARPKWGMETLTMHEAVPGHHLQISIAQELEGLPEFRKNEGPTAFVEGWGLYSESLGDEMGFYTDPYSKYGQKSYELWRAVRLVVDTGMHSKGWSRDRALKYFMDLLPKSQLESEVEIDRYIVMPGQALAYKVGQLKFIELRERAKKQLGSRFDIREFHEEILRHGALPMSVLEQQFSEWLDKKAKG